MSNNVYWFDPETMDPLVNTPGHVRALEQLIKLSKTGPSAMWGWSLGEAWDAFLRGKAVITFSWGDVGALAQLPESSTIMGKVGAAGIPGSTETYDLEKKQWVKWPVDKPNFVGNTVGASWHGVISKYAKNPDLAAHFLSWQSTPQINFWNVAYGWTGLNPGTMYDFLPPVGKSSIDAYKKAGWNEHDATQYVKAYEENFFDYKVGQTYLRIPGTAEYWEIWDIHLSEAVTGQCTPKEALDRTFNDWNGITDKIGREEQKKLYQEAIGYKP